MAARMRLILPLLLLPLILTACTKTRNNRPPVANAVFYPPDVFLWQTVTLDATGSNDPDEDGLTFRWSIIARPLDSLAVIRDNKKIVCSFKPDAEGSYRIQLDVSDGIETSTAFLDILSEENLPPIADAGLDQSVFEGDTVYLDGSLSNDPNGLPLTYSWAMTSKPTGSTADFNNPSIANPTFTADVAGTYICELTVSDGTLSASDSATITVSAAP